MKEIGDVYQITPSSCNPYYSFKYEIEKAYPVYAEYKICVNTNNTNYCYGDNCVCISKS